MKSNRKVIFCRAKRSKNGTGFLSALCRYSKRRQDEVTSGQKIAVSIVTTAVIFAGFVVAAFAGLFSKIEARFYEPAKIADIRKQLDSVAEYSETYINTLLEEFGTGEDAYLSDRSIASYALTSPSDSDVQQRTRRTASLFSEASGLVGIRLIDANGRSVHFSTYSFDMLKQTDSMRMYKNYDELRTPLGNDEFAFFKVSVPDSADGQRYRIVFDGEDNRILFAFPFYDPYDVYRGTMIFYVNAQDFNRTLIARNLTTVANTSDLISDSTGAIGGFVFGMPIVGRDDIEREAIARWRDNSPGPDKIASIPASGSASKESYWILISSNRSRFIKTAGVYRDSIFLMPPAVQILLLVCVFITLFLTVFMLFNLRRDDMVVIRDRVKRFQLTLINEYFENKENINWADVSKKIAGRKTDVSEAIKDSLGKRAKRHLKETDALIDKSWDEIIGALSVKTNASAASVLQDSKEIRRMLEEILRSGTIQVQSTSPATETIPKEISLAQESAEAGITFETNTEAVNAATAAEESFFKNMAAAQSAETDVSCANVPVERAAAETEEVFFETMIDSETVESDAAKKDAALETEDVDINVFMGDTAEAEIAAPAESAPPVKADAESSVTEDVDIDSFMETAGNVPPPEDDIFAEPLQLGEPKTDGAAHEEITPVNFDISAPNFLFLDEERKENRFGTSPKNEAVHGDVLSAAGKSKTVFGSSDPDGAVDAEDIEPIETDKGAVPFSFTSFASSEANIQNLSPVSEDVIVEGKDGVFSIASGIAFDGVVQDEAFKRLVDSVIR